MGFYTLVFLCYLSRPRLLFLLSVAVSVVLRADLRLWMIGTDTGDATAFTELLNYPTVAHHVTGAKVVAAYKGGSPDLDESRNRVDKYAAEMKEKWQVKFVDRITTCARWWTAFCSKAWMGGRTWRSFKKP